MFTTNEIKEMEQRIGHTIPRPSSQTLAEDLEIMPTAAKDRGEADRLVRMAEQVHGGPSGG
jgi:hypothetical protein